MWLDYGFDEERFRMLIAHKHAMDWNKEYYEKGAIKPNVPVEKKKK